MNRAWERHACHYLEVVKAADHDWHRIEEELGQIRRAWTYISSSQSAHLGHSRIVLEYIWAMREFQNARGLWHDEIAWCERGLVATRDLGRRADEGTLLNNIAWCYQALGNHRAALEYYNQALFVHREVGNRVMEATTLNNIGLVYHSTSEWPHALELYRQALPICREVGDRGLEAAILNNIGRVYDAQGKRQHALHFYQQALLIFHDIGHRTGEASTLNNIGTVPG